MTETPGNGGPAPAPDPNTTPEANAAMLDKLLEAARTNPALREKFNAVVATFSGGSKAPRDSPFGDNPEDTPENGMEDGEMDFPTGPHYTGGDYEYIEELETRQLQVEAENEALRQALSTITTQLATSWRTSDLKRGHQNIL
ncbi:hypothetical protein V8C86DRAFT_3095628 [Haematococcus lacustris]